MLPQSCFYPSHLNANPSTSSAFHSITQPEIQDPCLAGCCLAYGSANSVSFSVCRELHLSLIPARLDTDEQVTINATCSWPISASYRCSKAFPQQMAMDCQAASICISVARKDRAADKHKPLHSHHLHPVVLQLKSGRRQSALFALS